MSDGEADVDKKMALRKLFRALQNVSGGRRTGQGTLQDAGWRVKRVGGGDWASCPGCCLDGGTDRKSGKGRTFAAWNIGLGAGQSGG